MPDVPVPLSAVGLRLVGQAGQTALNRLADADVAAVAEFDQHVTAVRTDLAACREPLAASAQRTGLEAGRAGQPRGPAIAADARCPDVPFAPSALSGEAVSSLRLLLYYACGLVEGAVTRDWWPDQEHPDAGNPARIGWESMRMAAICHLVSQAEAAAELHPDLRALT